jgi:hypothetical protein
MKKDEVRIGCTYSAKVSGSVAPVRITQEKWKGDKHAGWVGTNVETGRSVYIKSAQRLRALVKGATIAAHVGAGGDLSGEAGSSAKAASAVPRAGTSGGKGKKNGKATGGQEKGRTRPADRPMSALDAAARVLADAGEPMRVKDVVAAAEKKGLWKSKEGKTPEATVCAAIIREIRDKGVGARFVKKDRGLFAAVDR